MSFNTILSATKISPANTDTDPGTINAGIASLANGSFAVSYEVIDYVNNIPIVTQVFDGHGQLVQETFGTLLPTPSNDQDSDIAALSGGGFALAWQLFDATDTTHAPFKIFTAVYDNAGTQLGGPVQVDAGAAPNTAGSQLPQVTALSNGNYVVTWLMQDALFGTDVMAAVFNNAGQQVVAPINVTHSPGIVDSTWFLNTSQVTPLANGGFALTWGTQNSDFDRDVYTAIYDAQGQQVLAPLNLTHSTTIDETYSQVAVLSNGNYALAWNGDTDPAGFDVRNVYTAVFDAQGNPVAAPSVVGSGTGVRIAALTNGDYALLWSDFNNGFMAVYDAHGAQIVAPVNLGSAPGANSFSGGGVTALANGAFALTWDVQAADGSADIFTAVYDSEGHQLVAPVLVSNVPGGGGSASELVDAKATANGSYAITWKGPGSGAGLPAEYMAIYQYVSDQTVGNINVVGSPDINVDLSAITTVGGDAIIRDNGNLVTLDLHNLLSVGGNFVLSNNGALLTITLPSLATVTGSVDVSNNTSATTVGLGSLTTVTGSVTVDNNAAAGSVDLGSLTSAGSVDVSDNTGATTVGLGSLTTVTGSVTVDNNAAAGSVDLGSLTSAGSVDVSDNTSATTVGLGNLTTATGSVTVDDNSAASSVDLGSLTSAGSVAISGNTSVVTIDLGALVQAGAIVIADNGVVTLNLSALVKAGGDVSISNNHNLLSIDMPELGSVGGNLEISGNKAATAVHTGSLTTVDGNADISNNSSAGELDLSSLNSVGGNLDISGNTDATIIDADSLTTVSGNADISNNSSVGELDLSSLNFVGGNLDISGNTDATIIDASSLTTVDGNLDISGNDSVTVVDASSLTTVSGDLTIDLSPDATVDASALGPGGGSVHVIGDDGRETTVILGSLAQLGGTLTITTADGVKLTSLAGLQTITLTGTAAGNTLIGSTTAHNVINAGGGNDTATGGGSDDLFNGGAGDDILDGRGGSDTAVYSGNLADYSFAHHVDGSLTVVDMRANSPDGTDTLSNFELFQFADGTRTLADILPAPVITSDGGGDTAQVSVAENTTAVTRVTATNPNTVQALQFTIAGGVDAGKFQIDHATGVLSFMAAPDFEHASDAGGNNVYDLIVQVSDGFDVDTQALAVSVTNVNEAPVVAPLAASVREDGPTFSRDLLAGASDPDAGSRLVVSGLDATVRTAGGRVLALGTDYTLTDSTVALTAQGFAAFNGLGALQADTAIFHFGVSDGELATSNSLTLTVTGANDAPTLASQTAAQSATAGTPFSLVLPAGTFQDPDSNDHLALAATLGNGNALPTWLHFDPATGAFSGTPGAGDAGGFDVRVTATDTGGLTAADVFHFAVSAPVTNHAPVITSDQGGASASVIIADNTRYVATVHAVDRDSGDKITYSIVGGADQKLFAIDPNTGALAFKKTPEDGHSYHVTVAASDGNLQDTQTIKVQVGNGPFESGNYGVADTFAFKPHFGLAVVQNFDATSSAHDVLELDHALFRNANSNASPAATFDLIQHHSFQLGNDVVIVTDSLDVIDLRNTDMHALTATNFLLS